MRMPFVLLVLAAVGAGCASSGARTGAAGASASQQSSRMHGSRDVITSEELNGIDVQNAYQAVQRLRPNFLQTRGNVSITQGAQPVVVYVDETRMGGPSALQQIPIAEVKEIRYLNSSDATQRYGTGHTSGAIVVLRK